MARTWQYDRNSQEGFLQKVYIVKNIPNLYKSGKKHTFDLMLQIFLIKKCTQLVFDGKINCCAMVVLLRRLQGLPIFSLKNPRFLRFQLRGVETVSEFPEKSTTLTDHKKKSHIFSMCQICITFFYAIQ